MTELDLYKFINNRRHDIAWRGDSLVMWMDSVYLEEFTDLIFGYLVSKLADGGFEVRLKQHGIIAFDLVPICEFYGIEAENIVDKEEEIK